MKFFLTPPPFGSGPLCSKFFQKTLILAFEANGALSYENETKIVKITHCAQHVYGPIEVYLKLICLIGAIIGEYLANTLDENSSGKNVQHMIMYTFFTIHPIFELIYYYKWMEIIPKNLDYLSAILAFGVEGFLFHEHLHGRHLMDVQVHSYLIISIGLCAISGRCQSPRYENGF